ncbi:MAG: exodeoxyribonuclease VII small subunit [Bacilli bacterium]|nr:exodeoxyribonuclease VII small subunit [Bacilli bacterium]
MAKKEEKELSFEESLEQLESIVKKLENGDVALDDAITEFQKAMELAKTCDEKLKSAEETITKLVKENGEVEDFQVEE